MFRSIALKDLHPYPNNPRKNDGAVDAVAASIREFGFKVPIVVDKDNTIIAGHTRYKAAKKLGLEEVPCVIADDLTDDQIKAFRLADNKTAELADWDFDLLNIELDDIDMDMEQFGFDLSDDEPTEAVESVSLSDVFGVPPFSVLDTRQGYWQERKRQWKDLGIKSELGRGDNLSGSPSLPSYTKYAGNVLTTVAPSTSIFDPVLCEIMYKWFCPSGGSIYDCFAGGSVRGIVAEKSGFHYTGIDLRQEQVEANIENARELGVAPRYICDDSLNADRYVKDAECDFLFSCPPYADLEVYSDDPRDISNMSYADFIVTYERIISIACRKVRPNRFACFVVGDIRDKKGFYRNFVDETKRIFNKNGFLTYNEFILVEQIGTAAMRAAHMFNSARKYCKTHQNVLVFYNGDPKAIKENYAEIKEFGDLEISEGE